MLIDFIGVLNAQGKELGYYYNWDLDKLVNWKGQDGSQILENNSGRNTVNLQMKLGKRVDSEIKTNLQKRAMILGIESYFAFLLLRLPKHFTKKRLL